MVSAYLACCYRAVGGSAAKVVQDAQEKALRTTPGISMERIALGISKEMADSLAEAASQDLHSASSVGEFKAEASGEIYLPPPRRHPTQRLI
jgi:hypothetical protein